MDGMSVCLREGENWWLAVTGRNPTRPGDTSPPPLRGRVREGGTAGETIPLAGSNDATVERALPPSPPSPTREEGVGGWLGAWTRAPHFTSERYLSEKPFCTVSILP